MSLITSVLYSDLIPAYNLISPPPVYPSACQIKDGLAKAFPHLVRSGLYFSICDHVYLFLSACVTFSTEFHSHCSCFSHQYHFVNINLTWTDAQAYCRENYTDLATIDNMEEMKRLTESVGTGYTGEAWIGLKNGTSLRWQWSSGEGDTRYINWDNGQPNFWDNDQHCTDFQSNGAWNDYSCSTLWYFICYTVLTGKKTVVRLTVRTDGEIKEDPEFSSHLLMQVSSVLLYLWSYTEKNTNCQWMLKEIFRCVVI
uniref:C-type lectin domain-containing protein n=1 Tax=Paramormyrops kingsleyae TaxID=1676925 RepID=A0A3B3T717_9TELE